MPRLRAYNTYEGGSLHAIPPDLHVSSIEIAHYPPEPFLSSGSWFARHDSLPFPFYRLFFDDNLVWDLTFFRNGANPWLDEPWSLNEEHS